MVLGEYRYGSFPDYQGEGVRKKVEQRGEAGAGR